MGKFNGDPVIFNYYPVEGFIFSVNGKSSTGDLFISLNTWNLIDEFKEMPEYPASQGNAEIWKSP